MSQSQVIEILKQYCQLLCSWGIPVDRAFLYGSYTNGKATEESDIDVMIVSSVFDKSDDLVKAKAWRLTEKINLKIEPYTVGLQKFITDDVSPIIQIVKKQGIEIKF